ncbi:hypothetical protein NBG84_14380 [Streptomyces sp. CWNU-1]|uniref:Uncharacterized protein n=1 Tax=Streptomyces albipurpureus TaxID=2897419 RepID=A0ABT0UN06_9ACTN|nr:hypothetical protein [Streptomyces sp. CWNU-1]MCM2389465.1 hypothetical protein [Streptomyces sp. CWNU-1]
MGGSSEAGALDGVGEVEFAGSVCGFVPVAESYVVAVPEGVTGVGVAVDESVPEGELKVSVGVECVVDRGGEPLPLRRVETDADLNGGPE